MEQSRSEKLFYLEENSEQVKLQDEPGYSGSTLVYENLEFFLNETN